MLAIIGGSGLTELDNLEVTRRDTVSTPYGNTSAALTFGRIGGQERVFMARHGDSHTIPPHLVNYRANIWALAKVAKATQIVAVAAVGGIRADLCPGAVVVPHQIIDYTHSRSSTYFDGGSGAETSRVLHVDFTHPYAADLRQHLLQSAQCCGEKVFDGAVYAATQGPRLETAAEIDRLERDGADIVGMTGMPEAVLARELEVPYAAICVVANWAAGRAASRDGIALSGLDDVLQKNMTRVRAILARHCHDGEAK